MAFQFPLKAMEWSGVFFFFSPDKMQLWRKELLSELFEVENLKQPPSGKRSSNPG